MKITLNLNLEINPHDILDFELRYKQYLVPIYKYLNGYVIQGDFLKLFEQKERFLKEIIKELIYKNFIGAVALGKYNVLYLKRKALICIKNKNNQGDMSIPTTQQIIRSIMLVQIITQHSIFNNFYELIKDVYIVDAVGIKDEFGKDTDLYNVAILDITKRNTKKLNELIDLIRNNEYLQDKRYNVTFYAFGDRFNMLQRYIKTDKIQNIQTIDYLQSKNENALNVNSTTINKIDKIEFKATELDVLKYFNNREPV